jgi:hypothetical protein
VNQAIWKEREGEMEGWWEGRTDHVEGGASAADEAGYIVQYRVTVALILKQLDIGVKEVTLGDMNALNVKLVHQLQNPTASQSNGRVKRHLDESQRPPCSPGSPHPLKNTVLTSQ